MASVEENVAAWGWEEGKGYIGGPFPTFYENAADSQFSPNHNWLFLLLRHLFEFIATPGCVAALWLQQMRLQQHNSTSS